MLVVFEDSDYLRFSPLSDYRPVFSLRIGAFTFKEYLECFYPDQEVFAFSERKTITKKWELFNILPQLKDSPKDVFFINGQIIPQENNLKIIREIIRKNQRGFAFFQGKKLMMAKFENLPKKISYEDLLQKSLKIKNKITKHNLNFVENIFDLPKLNVALLKEHIAIKTKNLFLLAKGVYSNKKIKLPETVNFNTDNGKIFLASDAKIEPWSYLKGPLWVSAKCQIKSHARIENSCLGEGVKVGGEVIDSLFYEYSNKAHYGFVGNSIIGSWVNLGAGTTTSNLKNTYGEIKGKLLGGEIIKSEDKFLGAIIGDFSKVGINSSLLAGKLIGFGASVLGVIDENIYPFTFYLKHNEKSIWQFPAFLKMVERIFLRREKKLEAPEKELLKHLFKEAKKFILKK